MHEVLINRLAGLSLPRKSVVRLTDRPDLTLDVYRGRKTTTQQQQHLSNTYRFLKLSNPYFISLVVCISQLCLKHRLGTTYDSAITFHHLVSCGAALIVVTKWTHFEYFYMHTICNLILI